MSKKTQKKKIDERNSNVSSNTEETTTGKSKVEKIVSYIIYAVGAVLIILVIALSINCHGDAGRIAKKYKSLDVDNVFEYIKFDELNEKINNGESFHVLLINTTLDDADYYIFCVNQIAKKMQEANEEFDETIYVFDTYKLKDEEIRFFKDIKYNILKSPNLVYYEQGIEDHSVVVDTTIFYDVSDYYGNQYYLIFEYFSNFNNEVE